MNVCVLMFYDDPIKDYAEINYNINKLYCNKHNLNLILSHERLHTTRHPAWEKLALILKHIHNYDYIIWVDADAFFYVDGNNILDVIQNNKETNFIFSNDRRQSMVNTGIFIVKNSEYSISFLKKWAYDPNLHKNNSHPEWWENGVLIDMINNNTLDINKNCIRYSYGILQHFEKDPLIKFKVKPLIKHMAGQKKEQRIRASKKYFEYLQTLQ